MDIKTVLINYLVTTFICAVLIAFLWRQNRRQFNGLGFWLASYLMQFVGLALIAGRGSMPDFLSVVVGNGIFIGGAVMFYFGLERFLERRSNPFYNYILWALFVAVHAYFLAVYPSLLARLINLSLAWIVIGAECIWLVFRRADVKLRTVARPAVLVIACYGVVSLARVFGNLSMPVNEDFFQLGLFDTLMVLASQMLFIALTFSLFMTVNLRLSMNLREDMNNRKRAETKLRESEEKFHKAFRANPDLVAITRMGDGKFMEVSDGFLRATGYEREEIFNTSFTSLKIWVHRQDRESFIRTLKSEGSVRAAEYEYRTKSGEIRAGLLSAEIIQLGNEPHIFSVIHDITERKQVEAELLKSQGLYQDLVERQVVGVYRIRVQKHQSWDSPEEPHYAYEFMNDEYCRLTGTSREEHLADPTLTLKMIHPEDYPSFARKNEEVDLTDEPFVWEGRMIVKGETRWMHYESRSRRFPDKGTVWTGVLMDITERKQFQEKLQQAQAQIMEHQRSMTAFEERERLAHELHDGIGQTLGYINLQAQAVQELIRQEKDDSASQTLARLAEAAQEAHSDLRGYIKKLKNEAPAASENFFSALEHYCQHLRQAYLFEVSLTLPKPLPDPLAAAKVETHLTYIIREALSNARRYSGKNEAVVVIEVNDETVQAVIEDQGVGMPDQYTGVERRARERFGIRIMRERVNEIGGALSIESQAGKGTRVTVRLPRELSTDALSQLRVVIVDDHPLFADGLRNMLAARGVQVIGMARDGLEAQELAPALNPDLVLMDINMPHMNGLEATRLLKARMPKVKIVMLTTSASEADLYESLRAGASGYLLKGMSTGELFHILVDVARGEAEFSAEMAQRILAEFSSSDTTGRSAEFEPATETGFLTGRQIEILRLVANGLMYKEIGERLFLSERTVKYHMGEILARLQLKGRRGAEAYAKSRGIQ